MNVPDDWCMGDDGMLVEDCCLDNSKETLPHSEIDGVPTRSEKG